jgi:hypothetical protein
MDSTTCPFSFVVSTDGCSTHRPFRQLEIMRQHEIIYLYSPWHRFHKDWKLLGDDLVTHVWADDEHVIWCFVDPDKCLKTDKNPTGMLVELLPV